MSGQPRHTGWGLCGLALILGCGGGVVRPVPEPACGAGPCNWTTLQAAIDSAVASGAAPGAVIAISAGGARFYHAAGRFGADQPARPDRSSVYDLASLTKVVALTTLAMVAVDQGRLDLDAPVARYLPAFRGPGKELVTVRHLLTHSSGLPAHRALWRESPGRDSALALVLATPLDTAPGTRTVYSDLGAITLGLIVERAFGDNLAALADRLVFRPLKMGSTRFRPPLGTSAGAHRIRPVAGPGGPRRSAR
jgi:CubicO group peptidase (beta-lactamase class C family)